ncbi:Peptidase family M50 [Polystyrenella longa]|uniref:Peptidase family M50 n=1 Tax=Polystyrenella longa TaxID=2528007 RepID=A0A518CK46_9PLAN|nr:site-2 protease family protein [Polystyrenella longa]QDU79587.1 Peptidase family M50 [Polystyrenella longa]
MPKIMGNEIEESSMFGRFGPTPFDIRFQLIGIPVIVHPAFWLLAAMFSWREQRLDLTMVGMICIFVSILVHEMGHAILQRKWGEVLDIQLHLFGGAASFIPGPGYTPLRSILVSLAGPAFGFILAGIALLVQWGAPRIDPIYEFLISDQRYEQYFMVSTSILIFLNIVWGIFNLLPLPPLDGGHVSMDVCKLISRRNGEIWAYRIAIVTAGLVILYIAKFAPHYRLVVLWCLLLGYQNWQALNQRTGKNW